MILHTIWVKYKGDERDDPDVFDVWSEFDIDNNHEGWLRRVEEAKTNSDIVEMRIVDIDVDMTDIRAAFTTAKAKAEVGQIRED